MILVLQVAIGIVLGWSGIVCISAYVSWRREAYARRVLAPGAGIANIPRPKTGPVSEQFLNVLVVCGVLVLGLLICGLIW
jgi:hypothetical protein